MDQKHKAAKLISHFPPMMLFVSRSHVKKQSWTTALPALDVAGVFPRWYPDKWLTEDDNPQNNKIEAWGGGD